MNIVRRFSLLVAALLVSTSLVAQTAATLDIYFIDVEGGQSTLFVTPQKESLLIDTGWDDHDSRDAHRIVDIAHRAGLTHIDTVIITHYHDDHVGGVPNLAALIPVGTFVDHGPLFEKCPACVKGFDAYQQLLSSGKYKRDSVHPGDTLPYHDINVKVVSANGDVISTPLTAHAQPNSFCAKSEIRPEDMSENSHSVGVVIDFGRFHTSDLGDLTWDQERKLMCPDNKIGNMSLLIVSHHGWAASSSPAYVAAIHARAAIMDNGQTKGGSLPTFQTLNAVHGMGLWQLHHSDEAKDANAIEAHIANLTGDPASDKANYIKVSAKRDGSFIIFNARTKQTQNYPAH
jgi:competence protein ComEC